MVAVGAVNTSNPVKYCAIMGIADIESTIGDAAIFLLTGIIVSSPLVP